MLILRFSLQVSKSKRKKKWQFQCDFKFWKGCFQQNNKVCRWWYIMWCIYNSIEPGQAVRMRMLTTFHVSIWKKTPKYMTFTKGKQMNLYSLWKYIYISSIFIISLPNGYFYEDSRMISFSLKIYGGKNNVFYRFIVVVLVSVSEIKNHSKYLPFADI
jgi:hypothetical protein